MYMPTSYGDPAAEYERVINGVAMWDVGVQRQVAIKGPDALKFARYLTPRNLDVLKIGQGRYVPICNYEGKLINDPVLFRITDDEIWLSIADSDIALWAGGIAGARGMDVKVYEPDVSPLAIQGPKAVDVAAKLFGDWVRRSDILVLRRQSLRGSRLFWRVNRDGQNRVVMNLSARWSLWCETLAAGQTGWGGLWYWSWHTKLHRACRVGLISYGADTDDVTTPFELGMDKYIDVDQQEDFIGKKSLRTLREAGVKRRLMGLADRW